MNQLDPVIYNIFLELLEVKGSYQEAAGALGLRTSLFYKRERRIPEYQAATDAIALRWLDRLKLTPGKHPWRQIARAKQAGQEPATIAAGPIGTATEESASQDEPGPNKTDQDEPAQDEPAQDEPAQDETAPVDTPCENGPMWIPQPGRQREAYDSPADILLYGGAAGGGKSDLLLGLALTQHSRAIVFRREYPQLKALEDRATELTLLHGRLSNSRHLLRFRLDRRQRKLDRQLEFGAVHLNEDIQRYQGRAHDLKAFDEITHFTETQFRFLIGWNRSADAGQRVRVVAAGNPPSTAEGDWIIKFWGPWLDKNHPRPAAPGELRWYAFVDGEEREVASGDPIRSGKELIQPVSRSFIPARVEDNRYLMESGYKARLQSLPEPLRSQLLNGDFGVAQSDEANQLIPTEWVKKAMDRWSLRPPEHMKTMTHIGVDVARGGKDRTVLSPRYGLWFGWQRVFPGRETPSGLEVALQVADMIRVGMGGPNVLDPEINHPVVQVDVIGVGGAVHDMVRMRGLISIPLSSAALSTARDRTGQLSFMNKRAEWWWRLREALDPEIGLRLMLPPDRELLGDLCAPRWELSAHGIKVEGKDAIRQRLGRSTDKGDALIYAWAQNDDDNWAYVRREIARARRDDIRDKPPREQTQVVARTTFGQPHFAFNPDGSRRPDIEPLDPATVKPGPWWRFDKRGKFELLDPWAKYK